MPQSVTANFLAAQKADVASYAWKVQLVLGDYANGNGNIGGATPTATSSGDDASGNYPAAGAINGDRTELNVGAASGADNGVGKASWRSSGVVTTQWSLNSPVYYSVVFGASRTFSRTKLYNLSGHGLKAYTLEYWDGTQWVVYAATANVIAANYVYNGVNGFGNPNVIAVTSITATNKLDSVDHGTVTATKMRVIIADTQVASDVANIVEVEIYRLVDISGRVMSVRTSRQRDYKLKSPLAATAEVLVDNTDQFFSLAYTPTAAQTAAGYVNSELRANAGLIVKNGFNHAGGTETVATFTGKVDSITNRARARTAVIRGRDGTKALINQVVSTKLKTSQRIDQAVQYLLNLANISNYEMSLQAVNITLPYFFVYQTSVLTALQNLAQAAIFPTFYFDESGTAQFASASNTQTVFGDGDWAAGTVLTNIDDTSLTAGIQRGWFRIDDFADGDYISNPVWTSLNGSWSVVSSQLQASTDGTSFNLISTPVANNSGTWSFLHQPIANTPNAPDVNYLVLTSNAQSAGTPSGNGYSARCNVNGVSIYRWSGGIATQLANAAYTFTNGTSYTVDLSIDGAGNIKVYVNGVLQVSTTDTTYSSFAYLLIRNINGKFGVTNIYWSAQTSLTSAVTNAQAVYESAVFDRGTNLTAEGVLTAIYDATQAGTSLTFYTATSADNITWEAYKAVTPGSAIASTPQRYIKFKIVLAAPEDDGLHNANFFTPIVYQVTLSWLTAGNLALRYDSTIIDLEYEQADDLGGDATIYNDMTVTGAPLVLSGADTDTRWQGTAGATPAAISASNPITYNAGTYLIQAIIPGGMDTANMAGGTAIAITWGSAVGSASISYVHPTLPIIKLVVTTRGTITDLRLIGKAFGAATTQIQANVKNTASIALYDDRQQTIANNYIVSYAQAVVIATNFVSKYASPTTFIPSLENLPLYSAQLGDAVTVTDTNTGLSSSMNLVGINSEISVSGGSVTAKSRLKLLT